MIAHRAAIASLAIACATDAGCRAPGIAPLRTESGGPPATGEILEPPLSCVRPEKSFTITFATFIPANHLVAPHSIPNPTAGSFPPCGWPSPATIAGSTWTRPPVAPGRS